MYEVEFGDIVGGFFALVAVAGGGDVAAAVIVGPVNDNVVAAVAAAVANTCASHHLCEACGSGGYPSSRWSPRCTGQQGRFRPPLSIV